MFMKPMLAVKRDEPFDDERYLFEPLIDGQRLQLVMEGGRTKLLSRHGYDVTRQYPELHNVPLRSPADIVLDGEVAYLDPETGLADYEVLQRRYRLKRQSDIRAARREIPVMYLVFDILSYNGIDLRDKPLSTRKRLLQAVLDDNANIKRLSHVEREGRALFKLAEEQGLEGIIGKAKGSGYAEGRNESWLTIVARTQKDTAS